MTAAAGLLALASLASAAGTRAPAVHPWAAVSPCKAVFFFPAPLEGWHWDLPRTPVKKMEYAWLVDVPIGKTRMQWGVTKFKFTSSTRAASGSLATLLAASQTNAWDVTRGQGAADRDAVVTARILGSERGLRIVVTEPKLLGELYRLRPASVGFKTVALDAPKGKTVSVPVDYRADLTDIGEGSCPSGPVVL